MKYTPHRLHQALIGMLIAGITATSAEAQIAFTGATKTENFDGLPTATVASVFSNTVGTQAAVPNLTGWSGVKLSGTGTAATGLTIGDGSGTNLSGGIYNLGTTSATDRALGLLASGSNVMAMGAEFLNTSGGVITSVTIGFTAEFWRSSTTNKNTLTFGYGINPSNIPSATYLSTDPATPLTTLNIVGPDPVTTNGALDGNLTVNRTVVQPVTINGLSWAPNTILFLRWTDVNETGNDAALAIDDFSISGVVNTGSDVTQGGTGTWTPSSFGGSAFTANDTAVFSSTPSTMSTSGSVVAAAIKFNGDGYSVVPLSAPATDTLSVTGAITVSSASDSATIGSILVGNTGLTKIGDGTLIFTGANTFSGDISIAGGTLSVTSESGLGDAENDILLSGGTLNLNSIGSLSPTHSLSGTGTVSFANALTINAPAPSGLTFAGSGTLTLAGATNTPSTLTFGDGTNVNVTGGALTPSSSLKFTPGAGTVTVAGTVDYGTSAKTLEIVGGTVKPTGTLTAGNRIIKTGTGTLDMTAITLNASGTNGGFRFGVQSATPAEGGRILIDEASDLGTATQLQFNSGTLEATAPIDSTAGLSIGGRVGTSASRPTLAGADMSFGGASSFFPASGTSGDYALVVNNHTTISGNWAASSVPNSTAPEPATTFIDLSGSGTLTISGNASAILDKYNINNGNGAFTLVIDGTLGGETLQVGTGTTLAGGGTFSGFHIDPTIYTTNPPPELFKKSDAEFSSGSILAPSGTLTFLSNVTLSEGGATILTINGPTIDTQYDSLAVAVPAGSTGLSYTLMLDGSLTLDFGASARNGTYTLFTAGAGTTIAGGFDAVTLTGSHTGALTKSVDGSIWTRTSGATFSFDESTGVLTVTGGAAATTALEDWRQTNFGSTANTGSFADSADYDNDGIANLVEYATGTNPTTANANPVTVATKDNAGQFLTLSFNRINDPALTYTILASNDLTGGFTSTGTTYTGSAAGTVVYEDTVSLATPGVRRFLRLQVSYGTP